MSFHRHHIPNKSSLEIKHNNNSRPVWSVTTKFLLVDIAREKLHVTATTLNVLLELYGVLKHKVSVFIAELRYLSRNGKVFGILVRLDTCTFDSYIISDGYGDNYS